MRFTMRKGMAKGKGKGYYNIMGMDSKVHSQSAKGMKQPQKISPLIKHTLKAGVSLTEQTIETAGKTEVKLMLHREPPLLTAREIFINRFGKDKPNVMTPKVIRYGKLGRNIAYEFSSGDSLMERGKKMFGVTIVKIKSDGTTETLFDHSKSFDSEPDAEKYITNLKSLKDSDKDGIPDKYDCDSTDPTKQDDDSVVEIDEFVSGLDERANGDDKMTFKDRLKAVGEKVGEGVKKGVKATQERIAKEKEKAKQRKLEMKKAELTELKRPEVKSLEAQQKRVDELRFQKESADDPEEFERIDYELGREEVELNERIDIVTEITVEDYSDKELRRLAIRHKPSEGFLAEMFGSGDNPYKQELIRRVNTTRELNKDLSMARKGVKKKEEGLFDGIL